MKLKKTIVLCLFLLLMVSVHGQIIYVKTNVTGNGNGTSWANAYTSLQPALAAATSGKQIWVAKGTYKPTTGTDRTVSFQMKNGVKIYGGFAGTETSIGQRANYGSGEANETILSGDIGTAEVSTDNSYHVIFNSGVDNTALLDGFTITGGYADNYSEQDATHAEGGGILNLNSSPEIANCCFTQNYAYMGGGILTQESSPTITNCTFDSNSVLHQGGAIFSYHTVLSLSGCTFTGNSAAEGGAICNYLNTSSAIGNSSFINNKGETGGGIYNYQSTPSVTNCVFEGNDVGNEYGGAIYNYESRPTYNGCIFRKNHAKYGGGIYNGMNSSAIIQNCLFVKNSAEYGGGIENFKSSPGIVNCTFYGNYIDNYFGGAAVGNDSESNPVVKNSIFQNNYRTSDDSLANIYNGNLENVIWCCFYRDQATYPGEGIIYYYAAFTDTSGIDGITGTADDDFSLKNNSPCIGAGISSGAPATDILGATRGTPPDIGAYENSLDAPKIKVIYVKADATGRNDGFSWINAYTSLQSALNIAVNYDQIWVAKGVYKPTTGTDRSVSFSMKNMVKLYGGFAGTEAAPGLRKNYGPGEANETILSGNIGDEADNSDNSYHVFYHPEELMLDSLSVLDGFTIRDGNASGKAEVWDTYYGGGMFNYNSSPTIKNCFFTNNSANSGGGGMHNEYYSFVKISNCIFSGNIAYGIYHANDWINDGGGGIYCFYHSSIAASNCRFENDSAYVTGWSWIFDSGGGGGILCQFESEALIENCYFGSNFAEYNGNGISVDGGSLTVFNSIFEGSGSDITSGKTSLSNCLFFGESGISAETSKIGNCTFYNKTKTALLTTNGELINSVFWGNNSIISSTGTIFASNSCIQGGESRFSGNNNIFTNPLFKDVDNDDFHLSAGSPCISKGLNPAENNLIPLTDLDGNSRPLGSKTDMGAYECKDDGTIPGPTTFVLSNEGGLIDDLIRVGLGNSNLYQTLQYLQPLSGGIISDDFLAALSHCPPESEIFTAGLFNFSENYPVCINTDGTVTIQPIYGRTYFNKEGYGTNPENQQGYVPQLFTYATSPEYYINAGEMETNYNNGTTAYYRAFAIAWKLSTTFVLSNEEGGLIDDLIARGYGNSNLYQTSVTLAPSSNGVISEAFLETLALCPAESQIFTKKLSEYAHLNGGIAINTDGTAFTTTTIKGRDYYGTIGYSTYPPDVSGAGRELFTYAASPEYYIDAVNGSTIYKVFAIGWSQEQTSTLSVSTSTLSVAAANGSMATFNVTSNVSWTVASTQSWLSVNPSSGSGNGTVTVTAQTNPTTSTRTATVTVSGSGVTSQTVTVTQLAGAATLSVSANSLEVAAVNGSTATFNITSNTSWSITSSQSWLTVNPASGTNNSLVTVTAHANPTTAIRTATVTVSGSDITSQIITVTQLPEAATLTVSTNSLEVAAVNGSTATFNITSNISWSTTSSQSWLTVNPASGTDNCSVTVTAEANPTTSTRTATVTVSGSGVTSQTVTVTQLAGAATLSVSANSLEVAAVNGSTATFNITSNTSWSITSSQSWLTVNPTSGTNNSLVTVTAEANPTTATRTATVTVSGSGITSQIVTVTQLSEAATLTVSTNSLEVAAVNGSTATFNITSNTSWSTASSQSWLTVNPASGTDNCSVTVTAEANPTISTRTATVTVSGSGVASQSVTVTQSAGTAILEISASSLEIGAEEGSTVSFTVTSNTNWTVSSDQIWLSVNPASGTGDGTVIVTAEANSTSAVRTAIVTVSADGATSQTVTVTVTQPTTVGIWGNELPGILVYPNPFSDGFYVNPGNKSILSSVSDLNGRTIIRKNVSSPEFIPTQELPEGVYLIELTGDTFTVKRKMIKK